MWKEVLYWKFSLIEQSKPWLIQIVAKKDANKASQILVQLYVLFTALDCPFHCGSELIASDIYTDMALNLESKSVGENSVCPKQFPRKAT